MTTDTGLQANIDPTETNSVTEDQTPDETEGGRFEIRKFEDGVYQSYKVLVIDHPDKWDAAEDLTLKHGVKKGEATIMCDFRVVPYSVLAYANDTYPIPDTKEEKEPEVDFNARVEKAKRLRQVIFFEAAMPDQKIEGKDTNEKAVTISRMPIAFTELLFETINSHACCLGNGDLLEEYRRLCMTHASVVTSPTDLFTFSESDFAATPFRAQRPFQDYIIEIPLKTISAEDREAIEKSHPIPEPPKRPGPGNDTKNPVPWYDEPSYQAKIKKIGVRKMVAYMAACLPFDIPGSNDKDKYDWLCSRPAGDLLKLNIEINEIIDPSWATRLF